MVHKRTDKLGAKDFLGGRSSALGGQCAPSRGCGPHVLLCGTHTLPCEGEGGALSSQFFSLTFIFLGTKWGDFIPSTTSESSLCIPSSGMEKNHFLQPFTPTTTATAATTITTGNDDFTVMSSTSQIILRIISVILIATISLWANNEASKGFEVTVINDAGNTPAGLRFELLFVSNDKAAATVLNTSLFAEKILYPNASYPKKQVDRVTLRLAGRNLTHAVVVNPTNKYEFVLHISPSVMMEANVKQAMASAVQRGMARIWLWDGEESAPTSLLDGMVEYIIISAGFTPSSDSGSLWLPESDPTSICWNDKDSVAVAHFLNYCEGLRKGFIGRLNQVMKDRWDKQMVDDALGLPAKSLCSNYYFF